MNRTITPAFLFDLDGALIDSVYDHVLAWRDALRGLEIELSTWRIHRRVGNLICSSPQPGVRTSLPATAVTALN